MSKQAGILQEAFGGGFDWMKRFKKQGCGALVIIDNKSLSESWGRRKRAGYLE